MQKKHYCWAVTLQSIPVPSFSATDYNSRVAFHMSFEYKACLFFLLEPQWVSQGNYSIFSNSIISSWALHFIHVLKKKTVVITMETFWKAIAFLASSLVLRHYYLILFNWTFSFFLLQQWRFLLKRCHHSIENLLIHSKSHYPLHHWPFTSGFSFNKTLTYKALSPPKSPI